MAKMGNSGGLNISEPTFSQLRATYANEQYVNNLGKFNSDDPKRQSRLTLANLRENRAARRDLAALHAARSHRYGEREFGNKNWYADKAAVARRLKSQTHRRQFRLGLKANMEFFNQLRIADLRTALMEGDPSVLGNLPTSTKGTVAQFREFFALTPASDVLKLFVPHKAEAIARILEGIEALADFNQRLGQHLAAQSALEPIHAVICDMMRSGAGFGLSANRTPLAIATQAVQHMCTTPDDDASIFAKVNGQKPAHQMARGRMRFNRTGTGVIAARLKQCCFSFQTGKCSRPTCMFRHICDICGKKTHGSSSCPEK